MTELDCGGVAASVFDRKSVFLFGWNSGVEAGNTVNEKGDLWGGEGCDDGSGVVFTNGNELTSLEEFSTLDVDFLACSLLSFSKSVFTIISSPVRLSVIVLVSNRIL